MATNKKRKVALVTGGGHGIGKAIALALARDGFDIVICGHTRSHLTAAQKEIAKCKVNVFGVLADATDGKSVKRFFARDIAKIGRLDVLVNNIGRVETFGGFADLTDEAWEAALDLNFMSAVRFTREALPFLRKSKAARIINISSIPGRQPGFFNPHYAAAKAALVNLSKYLANTLASEKILVNTICPGTLKGGGWERNVADRAARLGVSKAEAEKIMEEEDKAKVPLKEMGLPEDVAELAAFLASDKAKFITGTCVSVDGGVTRAIF